MTKISEIISKECQKNGLSKHDSDILGKQAEEVYDGLLDSNKKSLLDKNFVKSMNVSKIESQFDRLAEIAFTKFLKDNGAVLKHINDEGPDIFIDSINKNKINTYGEYKNIHSGENKHIVTKEDFKTRLTNAIDKKFLKIHKDIHKGIIQTNQPVILFFSYPLLLDDSIEILKHNRKNIGKIPPIEVDCLVGEEFNKSEKAKIFPRYFIDLQKDIWDDEIKQYVNVDLTNVSAVVFSECITNSIFEDAILNYKWNNDLIMVHNPNARNLLPNKLFPTWFEFRINETKVRDGVDCLIQEIV